MSGALPPPATPPWGGQRGPAARIFRARPVWVRGPITSPTAFPLASWRCAPWRWQEGVAQMGAPHRREGRVTSIALPPPASRASGRQLGSAAHLLWAQVCGYGDPALALWRARPVGCCMPRGMREVFLGGGPLTVVRGVWCQALSLSRLPALGAVGRAPLPSLVGRGCAGLGARRWPFGVRALRNIARRGGGRMLPRGGTSQRCEGRLVSGAFPLPAARSRGWWPGPVAHVPLAWVLRVGGPSTGSTARALVSRCSALWGWQEGIPRGGAPRRCEGRLGSSALPPPAARPWGRQAGSAAQLLWASVWGCGDPAVAPWRARPVGCRMPRGWRGVSPGGGGPLTVVRGVWSQAFSCLPAARPWGRWVGPAALPCWARVVWAWGPSTGPEARALASRRCALWEWQGDAAGGGMLRAVAKGGL